MGQAQTAQYQPQFPKAHALFLGTYVPLMRARGQTEIAVWANRMDSLCKAFEVLKEERGVTDQFADTFHWDIDDIIQKGYKQAGGRELSTRQLQLVGRMREMTVTFGKR